MIFQSASGSAWARGATASVASAIAAAASRILSSVIELARRALQIILFAERAGEAELGLEEVDVVLGVGEDLHQHLAADVVGGGLALRHALDQRRTAGQL